MGPSGRRRDGLKGTAGGGELKGGERGAGSRVWSASKVAIETGCVLALLVFCGSAGPSQVFLCVHPLLRKGVIVLK